MAEVEDVGGADMDEMDMEEMGEVAQEGVGEVALEGVAEVALEGVEEVALEEVVEVALEGMGEVDRQGVAVEDLERADIMATVDLPLLQWDLRKTEQDVTKMKGLMEMDQEGVMSSVLVYNFFSHQRATSYS